MIVTKVLTKTLLQLLNFTVVLKNTLRVQILTTTHARPDLPVKPNPILTPPNRGTSAIYDTAARQSINKPKEKTYLFTLLAIQPCHMIPEKHRFQCGKCFAV